MQNKMLDCLEREFSWHKIKCQTTKLVTGCYQLMIKCSYMLKSV